MQLLTGEINKSRVESGKKYNEIQPSMPPPFLPFCRLFICNNRVPRSFVDEVEAEDLKRSGYKIISFILGLNFIFLCFGVW